MFLFGLLLLVFFNMMIPFVVKLDTPLKYVIYFTWCIVTGIYYGSTRSLKRSNN